MILAVLLAHLFGDYILQWDALSRWKSQAIGGVLTHGLIVTAMTLLFTTLVDAAWWPWALFIGVTHTLIDAAGQPVRKRSAAKAKGLSSLTLFAADQAAHLYIIAVVLIWSGYLRVPSFTADLVAASNGNRPLAFGLGYAFLTMPAWVIIKFTVHGLIQGTAPDFTHTVKNKYFSMLERSLIATFVMLGQFILVPFIALPHLVYEWRGTTKQSIVGRSDRRRRTLQLAEFGASIVMAVTIGLVLRQIR